MGRMARTIFCLSLIITLALGASPAQAWWIFGAGQATSTPQVTPMETPVPTPAASPQGGLAVGGTDADGEERQEQMVTATPLPAPTPQVMETQEEAQVRVYLRSLGQVQALNLTLMGSYSVENDKGFRFADGTQITLAVEGGNLLMYVGGLTIDMGPAMTLTRHAVEEGKTCGAAILETGRENLYCGDLSIQVSGGSIQVIVTLDVEDYLYGVLPYEMSDSFPLEALKAQAVAARTYVMSRKNPNREYDVVDTPSDQVYRGLDVATQNAILAVDQTRGVVGWYKDEYAVCYYSATNGGQTELPQHIWGGGGDYGYLAVVDDPYDLENPESTMKTRVLSADPSQWDGRLIQVLKSGLTEQMSALGYSDEVEDIRIVSILSMEPVDPKYGEGNRMYQKLRVGMQVEGKKMYAADPTPNAQTTPMNLEETVGQTLYADIDFYGDLKPNYDLGMNSIDCEILSVVPLVGEREAGEGETPDAYRLEVRRYGHGVGLSQRGAQWMAGNYGMTWTQILAFYYPGMTLVQMDYAREELAALPDLPQSLGYARVRPTPKPTPKPLPALQEGEQYATVKLASASSTLNVREQPSTQAVIVGTLDHGQRLIVEGQPQEGWAKIKTAELEGYCSTDYLVIEDP